MRLILAIRVMFRILFSALFAREIAQLLERLDGTPPRGESQAAESGEATSNGATAAAASGAESTSGQAKSGKSKSGESRQAETKLAARAVAPKPPARSEALTLLAALQREARFVDLVQESLDGYSDAQIGAASRDVLRDCGKVLERMFSVRPLIADGEGAKVDVPAGYDANRFRVTGNVAGTPPFQGQLVHAGWQATHCQLPVWSGSDESALVIAPAEVEVR